jgi:hypothetical protein
MSDATVLAVALSTCGYDVTMDQLDTRGTYVDRVDDQAIAYYVAQITACHLFLYVSTAAFESDAQRKWLGSGRVSCASSCPPRAPSCAASRTPTPGPAHRWPASWRRWGERRRAHTRRRGDPGDGHAPATGMSGLRRVLGVLPAAAPVRRPSSAKRTAGTARCAATAAFCGGERRFVVDQVSAGRPCPVCGVGAVRWS